MQRMKLEAETDGRLDVLVAQLAACSRSQAARWIEQGCCEVAGAVRSKPSHAVRAGEAIALAIPEPVELAVEKENIPITILYEDQDIAVVDKPCGMVVHPAPGNESGTLVNALLYAVEGLSGIGGVKRPGIVHRLDKDTSGVLMIAKNDAAHLSLSQQLKDRAMEKHYLAMVEGEMKAQEGEIEAAIARSQKDRKKMAIDPEGRYALTRWTLVENLQDAALLDVQILTGRTHQIRVHMRSVQHPVAGDPIYGLKKGVAVPRLMLHAHTLSFIHPSTGAVMTFTAEPPPTFVGAVARLRRKA